MDYPKNARATGYIHVLKMTPGKTVIASGEFEDEDNLKQRVKHLLN